jgi:hypothetical protein
VDIDVPVYVSIDVPIYVSINVAMDVRVAASAPMSSHAASASMTSHPGSASMSPGTASAATARYDELIALGLLVDGEGSTGLRYRRAARARKSHRSEHRYESTDPKCVRHHSLPP